MTVLETPAAGMTRLPAAGTNWKSYGLCREVDPDLFFPEPSFSAAAAKKVCLACDVRIECLEYAVEHGEHGIWGGLSDNQRMALRRARDPERFSRHTGGQRVAACGTDAAYQRHRRRGEDIDDACQLAHLAANEEAAVKQRETRARRRQQAAESEDAAA